MADILSRSQCVTVGQFITRMDRQIFRHSAHEPTHWRISQLNWTLTELLNWTSFLDVFKPNNIIKSYAVAQQ